VNTVNRTLAFTVGIALCMGGAIVAFALLVRTDDSVSANIPRPVWTEMRWPFPIDQWGRGKAYRCKSVDCGAEVILYLRVKLGFCNCTTGIADDDDLDRMGDFDLVGNDVSPLGVGREIAVAWMKGRSRAYALVASNAPGRTAISVAFNDRCDMVVATAVLPHDRTARIEPQIIDFLNSRTVLHWAEVALGL
jgi:hypothetical protein